MDVIERLRRAVGITRDAHYVWLTVGGSTVATAVAAGLLATWERLPPWSVVLVAVGVFVLAAGALNAVARGISSRLIPRSEPYQALTRIIEDGRRLRSRVAELDADPDEAEQQRWSWRIEEWQKDAEETIGRVAPFRLAAFRVDVVVVQYPGVKHGRPRHIAEWEYNLEEVLERLLYIRVTL